MCSWGDLVFDNDHTNVSFFLAGCYLKDREDHGPLRLNPW